MRSRWILAGLFPLLLLSFSTAAHDDLHTFQKPIDGVSVRLASVHSTAAVRYWKNGMWSNWEELKVENEQDPTLLESNLITFPQGITRADFKHDLPIDIHPIYISKDPISYKVASLDVMDKPRILTREEWGADESLLYKKVLPSSPAETSEDDNGSSAPSVSTSQREKDCEEWQLNYPDEFKTTTEKIADTTSNTLLWKNRYSKKIKLLVVHHTAQSLKSETRSGPEMMRALYQYHAVNRGWGDIGYHYVIDSEGQIYEGKAGGDYIVGGHAYCNNVGTLGIALIGNFDELQPPQVQMQSLQWLLKNLADKYEIDISKDTSYHGITLPPIVGHRQLLSTDCPGEYVWRTLDQVRTHVASNDLTAAIRFPTLTKASKKAAPSRLTKIASQAFTALSGTEIESRPGGEVQLSVLFHTANTAYRSGAKIGDVRKSSTQMIITQEKENAFVPVRGFLVAPIALASNTSTLIRLRVQLPRARGNFTLRIGDLTYTISATGKTVKGRQTTSSYQRYTTEKTVSSAEVTASDSDTRKYIRIRLTSLPTNRITLATKGEATVNGVQFPGKSITLQKNGTLCEATENAQLRSSSILRIENSADHITITNSPKETNRFRGVIECTVIDGSLVLINELPLESYVRGLSEEPDTEPGEKQKAFAIAARTYAAWYMEEDHRKFPGKPYDGSDSPAEFQAYGGLVFEENNPLWVSAVEATANQTLQYRGQLIKPPYFSVSDGRTRSPAEVGWKNFPFAEVFTSKSDPWCEGMTLRGHGVGMSGCGAEAQANEGKTFMEILQYYYPGTEISVL
jgi:peptidoglycan hydrolase-like amidase